MSGCDWQKERFSVGLSSQVIDLCEECGKEISSVVYKINSRKLCKDCFGKHPSLKNIFLGDFYTPKDKLYEFTDIKNFGKPTEVRGKAHWKRLLKEKGLTDDFTQDPVKRLNEIKNRKNDYPKTDRRFIAEQIHRELQEKNLHDKVWKRR